MSKWCICTDKKLYQNIPVHDAHLDLMEAQNLCRITFQYDNKIIQSGSNQRWEEIKIYNNNNTKWGVVYTGYISLGRLCCPKGSAASGVRIGWNLYTTFLMVADWVHAQVKMDWRNLQYVTSPHTRVDWGCLMNSRRSWGSNVQDSYIRQLPNILSFKYKPDQWITTPCGSLWWISRHIGGIISIQVNEHNWQIDANGYVRIRNWALCPGSGGWGFSWGGVYSGFMGSDTWLLTR